MKSIALTFDDGPYPANSPKVIETLIKYNIPATFMIWGEHAEEFPEILKYESQNDLFSFGNHTLSHKHLGELRKEEIIQELKRNDNIIKKITGKYPEVIRVPYGEISDDILSVVKRPIVLWSLDTKSWDHHDPQKVLERIRLAQDGDIVLMHDMQAADADALDEAIQLLKAEKFAFQSIRDLVGQNNFLNSRIIYKRDKIIRRT